MWYDCPAFWILFIWERRDWKFARSVSSWQLWTDIILFYFFAFSQKKKWDAELILHSKTCFFWDSQNKCLWITNIKRFHVTIFGQQTYLLSLSSLTMAKGKLGINSPPLLSLLPLPSLLSLHLLRRPCLPSQLRCNDCHCHNPCVRCYCCRLPCSVDCCLLPQFLLLSATPIATVTVAATADPVLAAIAVAVCCYHCHHQHQHFHHPHHQRPCRSLYFHQCWSLLLPLPSLPFFHVPQPPRPPILS